MGAAGCTAQSTLSHPGSVSCSKSRGTIQPEPACKGNAFTVLQRSLILGSPLDQSTDTLRATAFFHHSTSAASSLHRTPTSRKPDVKLLNPAEAALGLGQAPGPLQSNSPSHSLLLFSAQTQPSNTSLGNRNLWQRNQTELLVLYPPGGNFAPHSADTSLVHTEDLFHCPADGKEHTSPSPAGNPSPPPTFEKSLRCLLPQAYYLALT